MFILITSNYIVKKIINKKENSEKIVNHWFLKLLNSSMKFQVK